MTSILDILQVRRRRKEKILLLAEYSPEVRCVVHIYQRSEFLPKDKWCDLMLLSFYVISRK